MALNFTGGLTVDLVGTLKNTLSDGTAVVDPYRHKTKSTYVDGTGKGKAQLVWHEKVSLATTNAKTVDLTAIASGVFGTYSATKVKLMLVQVLTQTTGYRLEVGPGLNDGWHGPLDDFAQNLSVGAGGIYVQESPVDGWTVDNTHKEIVFNNPSGGTIEFLVAFVFEGANS